MAILSQRVRSRKYQMDRSFICPFMILGGYSVIPISTAAKGGSRHSPQCTIFVIWSQSSRSLHFGLTTTKGRPYRSAHQVRFQQLPRSSARLLNQHRGTGPCCPSLCVLVGAARLEDCRSFDKSAPPWFAALNWSRMSSVRARWTLPTAERDARTGASKCREQKLSKSTNERRTIHCRNGFQPFVR